MRKRIAGVIAAIILLSALIVTLSMPTSAATIPAHYIYYTVNNFSSLTTKNVSISGFYAGWAGGSTTGNSDNAVNANGVFSFGFFQAVGAGYTNTTANESWWGAPVSCYGERIAVNEYVVPVMSDYNGNFSTHKLWYTDDPNGSWKQVAVTGSKQTDVGSYFGWSGPPCVLVYSTSEIIRAKYFMLTTGSENINAHIYSSFPAFNPNGSMTENWGQVQETKHLPTSFGVASYAPANYPAATLVSTSSISWGRSSNFQYLPWDASVYNIPFIKFNSAVTINEIVAKVVKGGVFDKAIGVQVYALVNGSWQKVDCSYVFDTRPEKYNYDANGAYNAGWAPGADLRITFHQPVTSDVFMVYAPSVSSATNWGDNGNNLVFDNVLFYALYRQPTLTVNYDVYAPGTPNPGITPPSSQTVGVVDGKITTQAPSLTVNSPHTMTNGYSYYFRGWSETAGGALKYAPGATITATTNITLYGVWEQVILNFNLTISVKGADMELDEEQCFVFLLQGSTKDGETINLPFVVYGIGKTTIAELPPGNYAVSCSAWAWRYGEWTWNSSDTGSSYDLGALEKDTEVIYAVSRTETRWLDANSYVSMPEK